MKTKNHSKKNEAAQDPVKVKNYRILVGALAGEFDKDHLTIERWIETDSEMLKGPTAQGVYDTYKITLSDIEAPAK